MESLVLTIITDAVPLVNLNTTLKFSLMFHDSMNSTILHPVAQISQLNPRYGAWLQYPVIPHLNYTMIFIHQASIVQYAQKKQTLAAGNSFNVELHR